MSFATDSECRERLVENHIEEAVRRVYQLAFADDLTSAESKYVWMRVIEKLLQSEVIDRQTSVVTEWMGLK